MIFNASCLSDVYLTVFEFSCAEINFVFSQTVKDDYMFVATLLLDFCVRIQEYPFLDLVIFKHKKDPLHSSNSLHVQT